MTCIHKMYPLACIHIQSHTHNVHMFFIPLQFSKDIKPGWTVILGSSAVSHRTIASHQLLPPIARRVKFYQQLSRMKGDFT